MVRTPRPCSSLPGALPQLVCWQNRPVLKPSAHLRVNHLAENNREQVGQELRKVLFFYEFRVESSKISQALGSRMSLLVAFPKAPKNI